MLRPFWNSLLETTPVDDPFLTWEWQSTWWNNYGADYRLWLLVAWENEKPVGIFPLMQICLMKHGVKARGLTLIGKWDIDHCGIIAPSERPEILKAFGSYLNACRREWDILRLINCLDCGQNLEVFMNCFHPRRHILCALQSLPHMFIPLPEDVPTFQQSLPGKLRRKVRSKYSALTAEHECTFIHLRGREIDAVHMQDFFDVGLQGHFPRLYRSQQDRDFHHALVENMCGGACASLNMLYINGKPSAYHYGFIYKNTYYAWRTAFIPEFDQYAPGHIILNDTLEYFIGQGLKEFDFLHGDARYKREWTDHSRIYRDWQIVRRWSLISIIFVRLANLRVTLLNFLHKSREPLPAQPVLFKAS